MISTWCSVSGVSPCHRATSNRITGGAQTANQPGGRNWAGVSDPAVDAMINALGAAKTRGELVAAARALDRVLMWNHYVLPLYHDPGQRLAHWSRIARPKTVPVYGLRLEALWDADTN